VAINFERLFTKSAAVNDLVNASKETISKLTYVSSNVPGHSTNPIEAAVDGDLSPSTGSHRTLIVFTERLIESQKSDVRVVVTDKTQQFLPGKVSTK
jgi:hypothetical protein